MRFTFNSNVTHYCIEDIDAIDNRDDLGSLIELDGQLDRNIMLLNRDIEEAKRFIASCVRHLDTDVEYSRKVKSRIGEVIKDYQSLANNN